MIVRISTVGQFRLDDAVIAELNAFDDSIEVAVAAGNDEEFQSLLAQMHKLVTEKGSPLDDDEIMPSDVILPPPDETLEEARKLLGADGFVPDGGE